MTLLWIPLLSLIGSLLASFTGKLSRNQSAIITAIMPILGLALVLSLAPDVLAGETLYSSLPWIPELGVNLSFRLDGLALLFCLLILCIGLLVILYARYYLSENDSILSKYTKEMS